jgi:hypothetical protein
MDIIDRMSPGLKEIEKTRGVQELFHSIPRLSRLYTTRHVIDFGNTGLSVGLGFDESSFDFMPESKIIPEKKNAARYASMLCASLLELHSFLNDSEKMHEFGIDEAEINEATAKTNKTLRDAIEELFSKSDTPDLVSRDENERTVTIDLYGFKSLKEDDPLIKYLSRVSKRARRLIVTHTKEIESP